MIAVGFLVAYDYELLKIAIPLIYNDADLIILSIDKNRVSWTGKQFYFNEQFKDYVSQIDNACKISWIEGEYFDQEKTPQLNEGFQRNCLVEAMGNADWYIQLDADEYFIQFNQFVQYLKSLNVSKGEPISITVNFKCIFKKLQTSYLLTAGKDEKIQIATNNPKYSKSRQIPGNSIIDSPFFVLHQSWARSEKDIKEKIRNWGHAKDFDTILFYEKWLACNSYNFKNYINFHPIYGPTWPRLEIFNARSITEMIKIFTINPPKKEIPNRTPLIKRIKSKAKRFFLGN